MYDTCNRQLAPTWIADVSIDDPGLTERGRELLQAARSGPKPPAAVVRIQFHLTERELIIRDWDAPNGLSLSTPGPVETYLDRVEKMYGPGSLDVRRTQAWGWGGLGWVRQGVWITPVEYLNRTAERLAAIGEIVK